MVTYVKRRAVVQAFVWTPGCELPAWCTDNAKEINGELVIVRDNGTRCPVPENHYVIRDPQDGLIWTESQAGFQQDFIPTQSIQG